jgi:tRNA(Ile)-lysidine synthetase-like protein
MIRLEGKIPHDFYVACSGGVDSMAALSFLMRRATKPRVAYFNHGTQHSAQTEEFVRAFCEKYGLELTTGCVQRGRMARESREEYWRNERYAFLHSLQLPVITAHNLNDCIETWIFSSLHGEGKIIPYRNKNVIRPFRLTPKSELISWCSRHGVAWAEDASNSDTAYARNRIRHCIVPEALVINPGLEKVIRKKIMAEGPHDGDDALALPTAASLSKDTVCL